jgi:hypothetical protein
MNNNNILYELITLQRKNINGNKKLSYNDLKRISKYLSTSIFTNECSIWNGYTSINKDNKNNYINFFFNKKKYSLQRLLYINYIDDLDNEYLKYYCNNKGNCCCINHIYKVNDTKKNIETTNSQENIKKNTNDTKSIIVNFD